MDVAVHAINEGNIFRFLNKPCDKEQMAKTLTAALLQYRLVTAERHLLEQTLSGTIQVLTMCSAWSIPPHSAAPSARAGTSTTS